jgi:F-type H+-transporting ATPase subunit b
MELDWRLILFEVINFLVLMALLARFLFRPLRRVVDTRRNEMAARDQQAAEREAAAEAVRAQLEERLSGIDEEAKRARAEARARGDADAQRVVEEGREEVARLRRQATEDIEQAQRAALADVREEIRTLAVEAATRVVRGMHDDGLTVAYAREGARRLKQSRDLSGDDVVHVRCDPHADHERVRVAIQEELGSGLAVEVSPDPALVGGVSLATEDLEVEASASASLHTWELERAGPAEGTS